MKIGIIGAMDVEVKSLIVPMDVTGRLDVSGFHFTYGKLEGVDAVVVKCGPGKINAAICTQVLINIFLPDKIINIGVAGGIQDAHIGDIVVGLSCVQHDYDTRAVGDQLGVFNRPNGLPMFEVPLDGKLAAQLEDAAARLGYPVRQGIIATGDTFVADFARRSSIRREFGAAVCEMEGAAVAYTCVLNGKPCGVLRSVSDTADGQASIDFSAFAEQAAERTQKIIRLVCKSYTTL